MSSYKDIEKALWEKMDAVIDVDSEMSLIEILRSINDDEMMEQMDSDDMILGLAGVDENAIARINRRREYIKEIKRMEEKIQADKEKSLKRWKVRQNSKIQKDIDIILEDCRKNK